MKDKNFFYISSEIQLKDGRIIEEDTPLQVFYNIEQPERGARGQYGEPLEPDFDGGIVLNAVLYKGEDVLPFMYEEDELIILDAAIDEEC